MQFRVSPEKLADVSAEQWQARVDLAAAPRLAYMHGFSEGIFNHLTLTVPGSSDRYYQIPFGTHWSEVTASTFMEVGIDDGKVKRGEGDVERSCFCIHAPIHKALPQAKAVFHTHMPYASALTRLEDPRIKEIGQTEVGMSGEIAYDDEYTGPALDPAEGAGLARAIGDKSVVFVANHAVSTVGGTRPAAQEAARARGREDQARYRRQRQVQSRPRAAPFRCLEAHPRSQGAGLRDVVSAADPAPCQGRRRFTVEFVVPGLVPGIHVLAAPET